MKAQIDAHEFIGQRQRLMLAPGMGFEPMRPRKATGFPALGLKACALSTQPSGCKTLFPTLSRHVSDPDAYLADAVGLLCHES